VPGETYDSFLEGVNILINSGQHHRIQFNNLSILPNAEMGNNEYIKKFKILTVNSEIINIHGAKLFLEDDVPEIQQVVIETYSMSREEWLKTRAISWMISFLYYDKLVQIPILLLKELTEISYKIIFESFMNVTDDKYPIISSIRNFFVEEAKKIQDGGVEFHFSAEFLQIYWPADEFIFIKLTAENNIHNLYDEINKLLNNLMIFHNKSDFNTIITESVNLNRYLVSQPFLGENIVINCAYNIIEYWQGICQGEFIKLQKGDFSYSITRNERYYSDFDLWCKEIVWWGNKKGAYLYPVDVLENDQKSSINAELEGHY